MSESGSSLWLEQGDEGCIVAGPDAGKYLLVNEYLSHLLDRNYSPLTVRAYGFDLLAFCRWLAGESIALEAVDTGVLLRFLAACRQARLPGKPAPNVVSIRDGRRLDGYSPATINRRLAAITGLFAFREVRDPDAVSPVPKGREARWVAAGERKGLLAHLVRPKRRSALRLRQPRPLPRALDRAETTRLLASLRTWRDRAIAGLMLFCGLRSCEVLALGVGDVDVGARWLRVTGKGAKERRVPLDVDVAGVIQTYLLVERPETASARLFVVAKGHTRGQPLTPAGLRRVFRYHRARAAVPDGHPHAHAAAHVRHRVGGGRRGPGRDAGVARARPCGHHGPLHPSRTDTRESRV